MAKTLLMDLRERLISVVAAGMSRRSAARFFSVAPSTAIKWGDQKRRTGSVRARARGGDHRSHRLAAHADEIVSLADNTDLTLADLADYIRQTHGLKVAPSTIWRLFDRHDMTFKKNRARRRTAAARRSSLAAGLIRRPDRARTEAVGVHRW